MEDLEGFRMQPRDEPESSRLLLHPCLLPPAPCFLSLCDAPIRRVTVIFLSLLKEVSVGHTLVFTYLDPTMNSN